VITAYLRRPKTRITQQWYVADGYFERELAQTELGAEYRAAMQAAGHANQYQRVAQF
jgi:hypothetical protein